MTQSRPNASAWEIGITKGLRASFKQPDGSSRRGVDWAVELKQGTTVCKILVRTYVAGEGRANVDEETQAVIEHLTNLLRDGWAPESWTGASGEISIEVP